MIEKASSTQDTTPCPEVIIFAQKDTPDYPPLTLESQINILEDYGRSLSGDICSLYEEWNPILDRDLQQFSKGWLKVLNKHKKTLESDPRIENFSELLDIWFQQAKYDQIYLNISKITVVHWLFHYIKDEKDKKYVGFLVRTLLSKIDIRAVERVEDEPNISRLIPSFKTLVCVALAGVSLYWYKKNDALREENVELSGFIEEKREEYRDQEIRHREELRQSLYNQKRKFIEDWERWIVPSLFATRADWGRFMFSNDPFGEIERGTVRLNPRYFVPQEKK